MELEYVGRWFLHDRACYLVADRRTPASSSRDCRTALWGVGSQNCPASDDEPAGDEILTGPLPA